MLWRFIPCRHKWEAVESGNLVRGGSTLTAGTVLGRWTKYRCDQCGFSKTERAHNFGECPKCGDESLPKRYTGTHNALCDECLGNHLDITE